MEADKWHEEDQAAERAASLKYRGSKRADARLLDMIENAGGFVIRGRPAYITRADRRRDSKPGQIAYWVRANRPDVLTPVQHEALTLYYGTPHAPREVYCVDDDGHAVAPPEPVFEDAVDGGSECSSHSHIRGPLSQSQAARYLGISVGAFRDRLQRAEQHAADAWNYYAARRRNQPIPDLLTKYRRRRAKAGRASTVG